MVALLIAGTTSDAGKSIIAAGLCRALSRRGLAVAPFKAQNMSNNSAVCPTGGEIGRAQAMQAAACGLEPHVDFNPILLKPGSDRTSQLVVRGIAQGQVSATSYVEHRRHLREVAAAALKDLQSRYDIVVCEGAGSPAEINLRATDVANFGLAEAADLPVYVVGDIDRGGVLAHLYGTHAIVQNEDRARIVGFVINKFRGDQRLLDPGLEELQRLTGVPTVAVLPYIHGLWLDAEDSLQSVIGAPVGPPTKALGTQRLRVAAVRLPRVSNATDVEALACEPGVTVTWSVDPDEIASADLVVLPGSKSTVADLHWLRAHGIADAIVQRSGPTIGICGGFQMMCRRIIDGVEGPGEAEGLGLFDATIEFQERKTLTRTPRGGYEIHHGQVKNSTEQPWIDGEGCATELCRGTHVHGLLEDDATRREVLAWVAQAAEKPGFVVSSDTSFAAERMRQLNLIADTVEQHWDVEQLCADLGVDLPRG
ncbi:Cobyric acid synthase [Corynebacterium ciconiae DSM 44920]|uniref:cobyric acid synthase n=1 Tax=Corynebacterium ciconiae TaxID=227319 RepID=UPI00036544C5|nr:cobyric acid synthase [Corynebacterium ciconiae]WKD61461.1 Cobyric acid synthase [Corynebacterium ciconiae DSM 44920]